MEFELLEIERLLDDPIWHGDTIEIRKDIITRLTNKIRVLQKANESLVKIINERNTVSIQKI